MSEVTYSIEFAKSGRSKCKKCKEPIAKGEIRLGVLVPGEDFSVQRWYKPLCFNLPRKLSSGANKISALQFVEDILEDSTGGEILPAKTEEIVKAIETKAGKKKAGEADLASPVAKLRAQYEKKQGGKEPPTKKIKKCDGCVDDDYSDDAIRVELYGTYHKQTVDQLKDYLRWNRQVLTGTKDVLLAKVIDGEFYQARLARCELCGGKLKLMEDGVTVHCSGSFDEDTQRRIECGFTVKAEKAPRWKPWFTSEPTEEQHKEMDKLQDKAMGKDIGLDDDPDVIRLVKAASKLEWGLNSAPEIKKSTAAVVDLLRDSSNKRTVDIPEDNLEAMRKVGPMIVSNKDKPATEIMSLLIKHFGFREDKEKKSDMKKSTLENMVGHPKNAALCMAFDELKELYFKQGNRNAGASYTKAVNAIKGVEFEITAENAKGLGKGKTKVAGIGKGSADKMYEFCTTGTIQKLEEKRAETA